MKDRGKKRVSLEGGDALGENPFADLEIEGLAAGEAKPPAPKEKTEPKREKSRGRIDVRRETSGRGGKTVTTLSGFAGKFAPAQVEALALKLKKQCACGGTVKGHVIELQGDVVGKAMDALEGQGFRPVRSGG